MSVSEGESEPAHRQKRSLTVRKDIPPMVKELRKHREAKGLSQWYIANMIGVDLRQVGCWERGEYTIKLTNAIKYAQLVGCELVLQRKEK